MITLKGILVVHLITLITGIIHARSFNREIIDLAKRIADEYDIHNPDQEVLFNLLGIDNVPNKNSEKEMFNTKPEKENFFRQDLKNKDSLRRAVIEVNSKINNINPSLKKNNFLSKSIKERKEESSINEMNKIRKYVKKPAMKSTGKSTNKKNYISYKDKHFWKNFWSKLSTYEQIKKINEGKLMSNSGRNPKHPLGVFTNNEKNKFKDDTIEKHNENMKKVIDDDILYDNIDVGNVDDTLLEIYGDIDYNDAKVENEAFIVEGELNEKNIIANLIGSNELQNEISIIDGDDFDTDFVEMNGDNIGADGEVKGDKIISDIFNNQEHDPFDDYVNERNSFGDENNPEGNHENIEGDAEFNNESTDIEKVDIANVLGKNVGQEELSEEEFEDESNFFYDNRDKSDFKPYRVEKKLDSDETNHAGKENSNIMNEKDINVDTNNVNKAAEDEIAGDNDETFVAARDLSKDFQQYHNGFVDQDDLFAGYVKGRNILYNQKDSLNSKNKIDLDKEVNDQRAGIENEDIANFLENDVNNEKKLSEEEFEVKNNLFYDNRDTNGFKLHKNENKFNDKEYEMKSHDINHDEKIRSENHAEHINNKNQNFDNEIDNEFKEAYVNEKDIDDSKRGTINESDKKSKVKIQNGKIDKEGFEEDEDNYDSARFYEDDEYHNEEKMDEDFGVIDYLEDIKLKGEIDEANRKLYEDLEDEDHAVMDYIEDDGIDVSDY